MLTHLLNQTESSSSSCSLKITADWESTCRDQGRASCIHPGFSPPLAALWSGKRIQSAAAGHRGNLPERFCRRRLRQHASSCQAQLLAALWSDAARRVSPRGSLMQQPPHHPRGGAVIWAPAALGRPPLNSSNSHVAAQPFHLKQQTDLSSCLFPPRWLHFYGVDVVVAESFKSGTPGIVLDIVPSATTLEKLFLEMSPSGKFPACLMGIYLASLMFGSQLGPNEVQQPTMRLSWRKQLQVWKRCEFCQKKKYIEIFQEKSHYKTPMWDCEMS